MLRDCNKPKEGANGFLYERRDGIWRLMNFAEVVQEGSRHCKWCDRDLRFLDTDIDPSLQHRCFKMIQVEHRRNEEKAHHKGDRSYAIRWLPSTGWTLLNKGEATKRLKLHECPFCRTSFPFLNQVSIE
jgi:glutaredoxin